MWLQSRPLSCSAESGHSRYSPRLLDRALREISATLSVLGVTGPEKDLLGRWKPEGSNQFDKEQAITRSVQNLRD